NTKDFGEFETECKILKELLKDIELFENYEDFKNELLSKSDLKGKKFFMPLRIILTGNIHGPELSDLYPYIKNFIHELARI
ncbi:glutamate--tRNA ligase, partial [Campylobacter jejuni subsp. jejuni]